jgi:hypothetical protein
MEEEMSEAFEPISNKELQSTMDARIWAKEFIRIYEKNDRLGVDKELMTGWFANAIMVGFDFGQKGKEKHLADLEILAQI